MGLLAQVRHAEIQYCYTGSSYSFLVVFLTKATRHRRMETKTSKANPSSRRYPLTTHAQKEEKTKR